MATFARAQLALSRITHSPWVRPKTQQDRNAQLLCLNTAMIGVGFGGIVAFLPVFLARLGADSRLMSWFTSAPALLTTLCLIPAAVLVERYTNHVKVRTIAIRTARLAYLLCAVLPLFVPSELLPIALVIAWATKTFPEAVSITAWTSVMARAVPPARRARLNGTRWALLSLFSAIGSACFGWLLDHIAFPTNYQIVFLISFPASMADPFFFARIRVPADAKPAPSPQGNLRARLVGYFGPVLKHKPFLVYLAATLLYRVALNAPAPLLSLYWVNELHAPDTLIGLRSTVGHGALVAGYILWGRIVNRLSHRRVLAITAVGLAFYPIITGLSRTAFGLLSAAAVWGLMAAGVDIGLFDLMLASCPNERRPLFAAVWSMVANGAMFLGPLLGARLSMTVGIGAALLIAGVAQIVTTAPFLALPKDV